MSANEYFNHAFATEVRQTTHPLTASLLIADQFTAMTTHLDNSPDAVSNAPHYQRAAGFLLAFIDAHPDVPLPSPPTANIDPGLLKTTLIKFFLELRTRATINTHQTSFKELLASPQAAFDDDDLTRGQQLLNQLRELFTASEELTDDHRHRLLTKLEQLQNQFRKEVSDISRLWNTWCGFALDAAWTLRGTHETLRPMLGQFAAIIASMYALQHGLPPADAIKLLPDFTATH